MKTVLIPNRWLMPVILATQEDHGSKAAWANSLQEPILKIPNTKRADGVAQGVGPEFEFQYHKKKKKIVQDHSFL
jgi:hypothetical protein